MRRLLSYLVDETLAGRGGTLKAYSVAVDGLGRPDDFDAQSDSYPRVQVGRLRRMLDAYYAREGDGELRIHIPPGRYLVEFAYPPQAIHQSIPEPVYEERPRLTPAPASSVLRRWLAIVMLLLLVGGLCAALTYHFAKQPPAPAGPRLSVAPLLLLDRLRASPESDAIEIDADAILLDGLRRSWLIRVRTDEGRAGEATLYRLSGAITDSNGPLLRLRLTREDSGALVWTGQQALPTDRAQLREALAPTMAELIQPYGVIASDQRANSVARFAPGYRCFLELDRYRRERTAEGFAATNQCIARTLAIDPRNAQALAGAAFLMVDGAIYGLRKSSPDTLPDALTLARRAVAADPYSAFAHLALARAAVATQNCGVALRAVRRAVTLNPNDADLIGIAGMIMSRCESGDAERYLREALALDPDTPPGFLGALIMLKLDQGHIAEANRLMDDMPVGTAPMNRAYQLMLRMVLSAFNNDTAQAQAQWRQLASRNPEIASDLDTALTRWMPTDRFHQRMIDTLARQNIRSTREPARPAAELRGKASR